MSFFDRRAFLELLGMGAIGAAVDVDRVLWTPGERTIFIPPPRVVDLATITGVATEALHLLHGHLRRLGAPKPIFVDGSKIGERGLTHQRNVTVRADAPRPSDLIAAKNIDVAMEALAECLKFEELRTFGELQGPTAGALVAVAREKGMSLRAISQYDIMTDETQFRFDVIGGRA